MKQRPHQHRRWAGDDTTVHKVKLRSHFSQVLYPDERDFPAVKPARKTPLLFWFLSFGDSESVFSGLVPVVVLRYMQHEPHVSIRVPCHSDSRNVEGLSGFDEVQVDVPLNYDHFTAISCRSESSNISLVVLSSLVKSFSFDLCFSHP
jgi:hypothetical protein